MPALPKKNGTNNLKVPWSIFDILAVLMFTVIVAAALYVIITISFKNTDIIFKLFSYSFPLVTIFIPYLWLKKRYKVKWNSLGLRYGKYPFIAQIIIGTITAISYLTLIRIIPFMHEALLLSDSIHVRNLFAILFVPFSLTGFTKFILAPFGEEILFRGVVYGYLRERVGILLGIFVQALISTMFHLSYIKEAYQSNIFFSFITYLIVLQIIFAFLYERTNSLYPSIICHGVFNYILFIY
jgi:CAAX protease family protein